MSRISTQTIPGHKVYVDTRDNILSTTGRKGQTALATDTGYFYFHDGTNWNQTNLKMETLTTSAPDMGVYKDSSPQGYHPDYIADKNITHSRIGDNDNTGIGQVRTSDGAFQWHDGSVWNDIVLGFRFREDSDGSYELEHKPIGFTYWYEVMSGNSDSLDLDGNPIIQQYVASMGAYSAKLHLDGGAFTDAV